MGWALLLSLLAVAFISNVPLGLWRRGLRPFSFAWVVAIHASVPLLILLRFLLGLPFMVIPPEIALAFLGQWVGGRLLSPVRW